MSKELDELLKEIADFDLDAVLASLNEPPLEVLLKDLHDSTVKLLGNLGDD
jgi:hypothetical protein